jgi:DNA helicase-2/ATP-dependent DNA helicase PcrA
MRQLYLTYAETRRLHGVDTYNRPSRFVSEVPAALLQEIRLRGAVQRPLVARPAARPQDKRYAADDGALRIGQRVLHGKFGEGVVLQSEGHGERARVQVNFAEGAKWLMLGFAHLQPLD